MMCRVCFKEIPKRGIYTNRIDACICPSCFNEFEPRFYHFNIQGYNALAIYDYDETIRKHLFSLKGCYDIELAPIFISHFIYELRLLYKGYIIVPFPSSKKDDEIRGFNHVEEIFKDMKLPYYRIIEKKIEFKQSDLHKNEREKISGKLSYRNLEQIENKKVLIVDDVMTTGSSMKSAINIIKKGNPKTIKILLLSKKKQ